MSFSSGRRVSRRKARWAVLALMVSIPLLIGPPPALATEAPPGDDAATSDEADRPPEAPDLDELADALAAPSPAGDPVPEAPVVEAVVPPDATDPPAAADPPAPATEEPERALAPQGGTATLDAEGQPAVEVGTSIVAGAPVVLVNGTPIDVDEGHRVDGCAVVIDISGLAATPEAPVPVGVGISAIGPTVPEGSSLPLVTDVRHADDATFTAEYDMTQQLTGLEPKTNGFRLEVTVTVSGTSMGDKQLWLACGASQDGRPNRIVFEVVWLDADGAPFVGSLDDAMSAGWRDGYAVEASSIRGTATCTIPEGGDQLVCEYDNPGHGAKAGLVVPGGKKHTYDVTQVGLPEGWVVDASTLGTFVGREACGTGGCGGGDHDDGGHDDGGCGGHAEPTAVLSASAHADDDAACTHTVINQLVRAPVSTTTTTTTTTAPVPQTVPAATVSPSALIARRPEGVTVTTTPALPRTGSGLTDLVQLGSVLVLAGGALRLIAVRQQDRDRHFPGAPCALPNARLMTDC